MLRADDGLQRVGLTCTAKYLLPYLFNQALPQLFFRCTFLCGYYLRVPSIWKNMVHYFCIIFVMEYYMMWAGQAIIICYYYKRQSWVVITLEPRLPCKERCTIFTRPPFPLRGLSGVWVWDYSGDKLLLWCLVHQHGCCFMLLLSLVLGPLLFFVLWFAFTITLNRNEACSYVQVFAFQGTIIFWCFIHAY